MDSLSEIADALPSYYEALLDNHIRLLTLDHEEVKALHCKLVTVDLATKPLPNALSYSWGDLRPEISQEPGRYDTGHTIFVNGHAGHVQANLYDALLRLRSGCPVTRISIWIDAICISQSDKEEKAIRVRKMDQICRGVNAVFAWLGDPDDYTSTGFTTVTKLSELDRRIAPNYAGPSIA